MPEGSRRAGAFEGRSAEIGVAMIGGAEFMTLKYFIVPPKRRSAQAFGAEGNRQDPACIMSL